MNEAQSASDSALVKTVAICAILEILVLLGCYRSTDSVVGAIAMSLIFFGPLSVWVGPRLYRQFERAALPLDRPSDAA
jgi:hypothetical protein